jgi:photosystem II stability/assembly factor-like uncharacterized protein
LRTTDGGTTWGRIDTIDTEDMDFENPSHGIGVSGARLRTTTDAGNHWTEWAWSIYGPVLTFSGVSCANSDTVWVAGNAYDSNVGSVAAWLWMSKDGGTSWSYKPVTFGYSAKESSTLLVKSPMYSFSSYKAVAFRGTERGIVVGQSSYVGALGSWGPDPLAIGTTDGGLHWYSATIVDTGGLVAVSFPAPDTAWVVGYRGGARAGGVIRKTTDGGRTWREQYFLPRKKLSSVSFTDTRHGWVSGDSGSVLATGNGGQTWTLQTTGTGRWLYGVFFTDTLTGWVVGEGGTILRTTTGGVVSSAGRETRAIASFYILSQNYPNPFNPSTTIRYGLPNRSHVTLSVVNTLGQLVAVLQNGEQEGGYHEVKFDGTGFPSGVYFYRMQAGDFVETRKLLLVR